MKKIITLLFVSYIFTANSFAQSLTVGGLGQIKNTWLINSNVMDQIDPSFGFSGGVSLCWYFNQHVGQNSGLGLDLLYTGFNQKYSGTLQNNDYDSKIHLTYLNFPLYYRFGTGSGAYFEVGADMSYILTANCTTSTLPEVPYPNSKPLTNLFAVGPLLGFGIDIPLTEDLYITTGLRFVYALTDLKGVDPYGRDISNPSL